MAAIDYHSGEYAGIEHFTLPPELSHVTEEIAQSIGEELSAAKTRGGVLDALTQNGVPVQALPPEQVGVLLLPDAPKGCAARDLCAYEPGHIFFEPVTEIQIPDFTAYLLLQTSAPDYLRYLAALTFKYECYLGFEDLVFQAEVREQVPLVAQRFYELVCQHPAYIDIQARPFSVSDICSIWMKGTSAHAVAAVQHWMGSYALASLTECFGLLLPVGTSRRVGFRQDLRVVGISPQDSRIEGYEQEILRHSRLRKLNLLL